MRARALIASLTAACAAALGTGVAVAADTDKAPATSARALVDTLQARKAHVEGGSRELRSVGVVGAGTLRLYGANRYETSVEVSRSAWNADNTLIAYLASGVNFPDALSAGASTMDAGPLLLSEPHRLPAVVAEELARLQPCFIVVVGGAGAISDAVAAEADRFADPTRCADL